MSEFGNEVVTASFKMTEKTLDALLKLLRYLSTKHERDYKKFQSGIKKEQLKQGKIQKKLNRKKGYVNLKLLQKSGEKLIPITMNLTDDQMFKFSVYCKKYGVVFSAIEDKNNLNNPRTRGIMIRNRDLELVKVITDRMNEDLNIQRLDEEINVLENKENLSLEEQAKLEYLKKQKVNLINQIENDYNNKNTEKLFEEICIGKKDEAMSFERALNRITDRDYSRNEPYYFCERTNPNNYIELVSSLDEFRGKEYTKTDYKVFNEEKLVGTYSDARFEGRKSDHWITLREEMKSAGEFTDDMVYFQNEESFLNYKKLYNKQQKELFDLEVDLKKQDYNSVIETLKVQLKENGMKIDDNYNVFSIEENKNIKEHINDILDQDEKMLFAESLIIAKQIENYEKIPKLKMEIEMMQSDLSNMYDEYLRPTEGALELSKTLENKQKELIVALKNEKKYNLERSKVNGSQAINEMQKQNSYLGEHQINKDETINLIKNYKERLKITESVDEKNAIQGKINELEDKIMKGEEFEKEKQNSKVKTIEEHEKIIFEKRKEKGEKGIKAENVKFLKSEKNISER